MKPMISVVVPVYNVEAYLTACIDSILNQTYQNWELILVDDGSHDSSYNICCNYAEYDERVRVFHLDENSGVACARNLGVRVAKGNYICFVDSDDTMLLNALTTLEASMTDEVDVVISGCNFERIITGYDFFNKILVCDLPVSLWGKLFRKEVLSQGHVMEVVRKFYMGEDYLVNMKASSYIRRACCLSTTIYQYRDTPFSVSHTRAYSLDYEQAFRKEVEEIVMKRQHEGLDVAWYRFQVRVLTGLIMNNIPFSYKIPWINQLVKDARFNRRYLSRREWIVTHIYSPSCCRFLFNIANKLNLI